jgi:hypothetical protein
MLVAENQTAASASVFASFPRTSRSRDWYSASGSSVGMPVESAPASKSLRVCHTLCRVVGDAVAGPESRVTNPS